MNLSDEEKAIGQDNFRRVSGELLARNESRRDFLKEVTLAGAVAAGGFGAAYWGYGRKLDDRLRVGIIGTGDEGNVLIGALNPEYIDVKAIADIRPYSRHRAFYGDLSSDGTMKARPGLCKVYGYTNRTEAEKDIKVYTDYEDLLEQDDIEAVIIALPLWLHHPAAVKAMRAGKHVLTEKLMGWDVAQCKEMARVAEAEGKLLATGHQRHYSVLYDNAVDTIRRGMIGDIHSIRAQWHRGNLPGNDSWQPPLPQSMGVEEVKDLIRAARKLTPASKAEAMEAEIKATHQLALELDSWKQVLAGTHKAYGKLSPSDAELWRLKVEQKAAQIEDVRLDAAKYGYEEGTLSGGYHRSALEELIRWRIWNRTGGGLMAELGSHQLDASGIFISSQFDGHVKVNPLSVTAVGGRYVFPQDRDCDDHVYATYEYPGKGYFEDNDPKKEVADPNKKVGVVYSSINGNGFGGYGEVVLGTTGTLILRALGLVHPQRRARHDATLPPEGRAGRRGDRVDDEHRHRRKPPHRVQPRVVRPSKRRRPRRPHARQSSGREGLTQRPNLRSKRAARAPTRCGSFFNEPRRHKGHEGKTKEAPANGANKGECSKANLFASIRVIRGQRLLTFFLPSCPSCLRGYPPFFRAKRNAPALIRLSVS
jgi:predicted dehydrogenase